MKSSLTVLLQARLVARIKSQRPDDEPAMFGIYFLDHAWLMIIRPKSEDENARTALAAVKSSKSGEVSSLRKPISLKYLPLTRFTSSADPFRSSGLGVLTAPASAKTNAGFQIFSDENSEPERRAAVPSGSAWAELPVERVSTKENTVSASRWNDGGISVKAAAQPTETFKIFDDGSDERSTATQPSKPLLMFS